MKKNDLMPQTTTLKKIIYSYLFIDSSNQIKKIFAYGLFISLIFSFSSHANIIFLSFSGNPQGSENTISNSLQSVGYKVDSYSQMKNQSGIVIHVASTLEKSTTGQGNLIGYWGGAATAIYVCQIKNQRLPFFINDIASGGYTLGNDTNWIESYSAKQFGQVAAQVLNQSTGKIKEWTNFCETANTAETPRKNKK